MFIWEYQILQNRFLFGTGAVFRIQFSCEKKLQVINLFNQARRPRWEVSFWRGCYNGIIFSSRAKPHLVVGLFPFPENN